MVRQACSRAATSRLAVPSPVVVWLDSSCIRSPLGCWCMGRVLAVAAAVRPAPLVGGPGTEPGRAGWLAVCGTLGLFTLVPGVEVGVVLLSHVGGLSERVGQRPQRGGGAGDDGRAEPDDGLGG